MQIISQDNQLVISTIVNQVKEAFAEKEGFKMLQSILRVNSLLLALNDISLNRIIYSTSNKDEVIEKLTRELVEHYANT